MNINEIIVEKIDRVEYCFKKVEEIMEVGEMNNKDYELIMEKIENAVNRLMALKNALIKYENGEVPEGVSFDQLLDDELFEENYSDRMDDCITEISIVIEHVLKIKYCTNNRNHGVWASSIRTHRGTFSKYVRWGAKKPIDKYIKYTSEHIEDCYDYGVALYRKASNDYPDLKPGLKYIPDECPWTLEELIDDSIDVLLDKIDEG